MKRRKKTTKKPAGVRVDVAILSDAIDALDASEQLLELLRGILNSGDDFYVDDLISAVMDRIIVSARIRLALSLPKGSGRALHLKAQGSRD